MVRAPFWGVYAAAAAPVRHNAARHHARLPIGVRGSKSWPKRSRQPPRAAVFSEILSPVTFCDGRRIGHTARGPELGRRRGAANYPHVRTHARASCG